jgi:hypothetical protein
VKIGTPVFASVIVQKADDIFYSLKECIYYLL